MAMAKFRVVYGCMLVWLWPEPIDASIPFAIVLSEVWLL